MLEYNTIFQNQMKNVRHQKKYCSQISLLYNVTAIKVSKLDLANSRVFRRHSKKPAKNSAWMRTFSNNIRFEKGIKVLSNKRLRTRNSLMVYTEMQFKIKFSPIPANIHFLLDIFKHLKDSHSSVSTYRYTLLLSCRQERKKKKIIFSKTLL